MNAAMEALNPVLSNAPVAAHSDATAYVGAIIDRAGYKGVTFVAVIGAAGASVTAGTVTLEEGNAANLSDTAAVTNSELAGTGLAGATFTTAGNANSTVKLGYTGNKQYLRMTITPVSNSGSFFAAGVCILSEPTNAPTPNPPAVPTTGPNTSTPA